MSWSRLEFALLEPLLLLLPFPFPWSFPLDLPCPFPFPWPFTRLAIHWVMESTSIGWGPELELDVPGLDIDPFDPKLDSTTNSISCFINS